jgi:hypothetical protein
VIAAAQSTAPGTLFPTEATRPSTTGAFRRERLTR